MIDEGMLIDRNNLDEECASAPAFFDYWVTQESNLKTEKENYESKLELEIRRLPDDKLRNKYDVTKLTEATVSALIKNDKMFQSLKGRYLHAEAKRKSYDKKISLLDTLAKLHGQGYFAKIENKKEAKALLVGYARKKIKEEIVRSADKKPERPSRNG